MNSPKDHLTDREKLMEKIEEIYPHSPECIKARLDFKKQFNMYHPSECVEPERIKKVEKLLALLTSEVEKERERLLKVIGEDEDHSAYTATQSIGMIERNKLRAEQRKALSELQVKKKI